VFRFRIETMRIHNIFSSSACASLCIPLVLVRINNTGFVSCFIERLYFSIVNFVQMSETQTIHNSNKFPSHQRVQYFTKKLGFQVFTYTQSESVMIVYVLNFETRDALLGNRSPFRDCLVELRIDSCKAITDQGIQVRTGLLEIMIQTL
jgi:hypothetical protein